MGFKSVRNLSVLLLASAALVGCNNNPQKDKTVIAPAKYDPKVGQYQPSNSPTPQAKFPLANSPAQPNNSPYGAPSQSNLSTQTTTPYGPQTPMNPPSPFAPSNVQPSQSFGPGPSSIGTPPANLPAMPPVGGNAYQSQPQPISPPSNFGAGPGPLPPIPQAGGYPNR